jgi:hypothetical protein
MRNKLTLILASILTLASVCLSPVSAVDTKNKLSEPCGGLNINSSLCPDNNSTKIESKVGEIVSYAIMAIGALSVVFIIIGGFMFASSSGDPEKVKKAKSTILYAIIGLALASTAYIITSLVSTSISQLN